MKIVDIQKVGKKRVYDISVEGVEHYILENGVVTHNTGIYLSADNVYIIGRQQEKEGTEVVGYNFIINVDKSRHAKEKSKIPITVSYESGISRWSGLIDIALASGHVIKPSNGWYSKVDQDTGEVDDKKYRLKETNTKEFWLPILQQPSFQKYVKDNYSVSNNRMLSDEEIDSELAKIETEEEFENE